MMDERLILSDFDIVGIINLRDVHGIEKYVTPIYDNNEINKPIDFLSRSKEYYNVKSMNELSNEREDLKSLLTREKSRRNFVILENMMNCSARVYFKKLEEYINNPNKVNHYVMEISKACLLEDTRNIITILSNEGLIMLNKNCILPGGFENCAKRQIEMDNKAVLYAFCKNLNIKDEPNKIQVVTPGYGSMYIGPFLKCMYGYDFTNILKSKYINETSGKARNLDILGSVSNKEIFNPQKRIVLIDDNIGTGNTMEEIKSQLRNKEIECYKSGAVQYNWRNYYKVYSGEKTDIDKFNVDDFEIITPFNYAGHKLYSHAIDILHESGNAYIEYLNSKSYRLDLCNDLVGSLKRGIIASKKSNLIISKKQDLGDIENSTGKEQVEKNVKFLPEHKMKWIDSLIEYVQDTDKVIDCENECKKEK